MLLNIYPRLQSLSLLGQILRPDEERGSYLFFFLTSCSPVNIRTLSAVNQSLLDTEEMRVHQEFTRSTQFFSTELNHTHTGVVAFLWGCSWRLEMREPQHVENIQWVL